MPRRSRYDVLFEEDERAIARQNMFRSIADLTALAWADIPGVEAVGATGGLVKKLWREMPYWRRRGEPSLASLHTLDMAVWVSSTECIPRLRIAFGRVLTDATARGVNHDMAHFYLRAVVYDADSDAYRGFVCTYGTCPKGKPPCEARGCGAVPFLQQFDDYDRFDAEADRLRAHMLFRRGHGIVGRAADLPESEP
ncbi:hypothetical protein [Salinarimonas sp.]|uniref:hypothetical protein n=1 Tax=Salinarimonas sp. TaxID=2766526 RepID=UPI00391875D3